MAWIILVIASALEIVWAMALKHSDGFTRLIPSAICISAASASLLLLSIAMRSLPVGTAYAVWVGLGMLGVVSLGLLTMAEDSSPQRLFFLGMIFFGVIGLKYFDAQT